MSKENETFKNEQPCTLHSVKHCTFGWFIRKPKKLIKYYVTLNRITQANKGNDYDYPEINWYMVN